MLSGMSFTFSLSDARKKKKRVQKYFLLLSLLSLYIFLELEESQFRARTRERCRNRATRMNAVVPFSSVTTFHPISHSRRKHHGPNLGRLVSLARAKQAGKKWPPRSRLDQGRNCVTSISRVLWPREEMLSECCLCPRQSLCQFFLLSAHPSFHPFPRRKIKGKTQPTWRGLGSSFAS